MSRLSVCWLFGFMNLTYLRGRITLKIPAMALASSILTDSFPSFVRAICPITFYSHTMMKFIHFTIEHRYK